MNLETLRKLCDAATDAPGAPIPGWHGYAITIDGRVFSVLSNWRGYGTRELAQHLNSHGYPRVRMMKGDKRKAMPVHWLMARTFLWPRPSQGHQVRHLDGNRTNNHFRNLAWGTVAENAADRTQHGNCTAAENGRRSAWKNRKTHCLHGHRYSRLRKNGQNWCGICHRDRARRKAAEARQ